MHDEIDDELPPDELGPLAGEFGLQFSHADFPEADTPQFEHFRTQLREAIAHLLKNDYQHLQFILYRLDVDEARANEALRPPDIATASALMTDVIIERHQRRIAERRRRHTQGY